MARVVGVILAGGHGFIGDPKRSNNGHGGDPNRSKLLESVGMADKPMLCYVADVLAALRLPMVVVVNTRFSADLRREVAKYGVTFAEMEGRSGTAGALNAALPHIHRVHPDCKRIVVLYGDMPCWKPQSIRSLLRASEQISAPVITMFRVSIKGMHPSAIENFGRILYDEHGEIFALKEPEEMTAEDLARTHYVNPSAWVYEPTWLEANIPLLLPHHKDDGFGDEYWLPDLVTRAHEQGRSVVSVELKDPYEALGVNNLDELLLVRDHMCRVQQPA